MPNSLPVTSNGSLFGWGYNPYTLEDGREDTSCIVNHPHQLALPSAALVAKVWAGTNYLIARTKGGETYLWGDTQNFQCGQSIKGESLNSLEYTPGTFHNLAMDYDEMVCAWGKTMSYNSKMDPYQK
jgi:alpha-tubulin suppressor-like RCC1 family protein